MKLYIQTVQSIRIYDMNSRPIIFCVQKFLKVKSSHRPGPNDNKYLTIRGPTTGMRINQ